MGIRSEIQEIVDGLTEDELPAARRALKAVVGAHGSPDANPDSLEALSEEQHQQLQSELRESRDEFERGEGLSEDQAKLRVRGL